MCKIIIYAALVFIVNALFPDKSYADSISPILNLFSSETVFPASVITLIIIVFEALFLRWRIPEITFKNHLWRSLIINIASSTTGSIIILAVSRNHYFIWESFSLIFPLYFITLITETPLLKALYKKVNITWLRAIKLSISVNAASYFVVLLLEFCLLFVFFIGPITPNGVAEALIAGRDFSESNTIKIANKYGDLVLEPLKEYSKDFTVLNRENAARIATVLGTNKSSKSEEILNILWHKENSYARLVAAIGLARHHKFPEDLDRDSFLLKNIDVWTSHQNHKPGFNDPQYRKWMTDDTELKSKSDLSIIALGYSGDNKALPSLLIVLKMRKIEYWTHVYACEAVARIASADAVPALEECLKDPNFYALPEAFRALITLNDKQAVPLAIARITPDIKNYNSGFIVMELTKVTGKDFGYNRDLWQSWWQSNEYSWTIPKEYRKSYDEQRKTY
jgi:hypothetical protein